MAETSATGARSSNSASSDAVLQDLVRRGWSFADLENIHATIAAKSIFFYDIYDVQSMADAVESELLNEDLRSIGAKSLPEPAILRQSTYLLGPKVLQNIPFGEGAIKLQGQADHVESEKLNEVPIFKPREQVSEDGEAAATAEETMTEDESTASRDAKQNLDRDPSKEKDMLLFKEEKVGADDTPKSTQAPNDTLVGDVGLVRRGSNYLYEVDNAVESASFSSLHPDILRHHVVTHLNGPTLAAFSSTSSQLNTLSTDDELWKNICATTWPSTKDPLDN